MSFSHRRLPHLYVIGEPLFITFHLYGSLPASRAFANESMTSGEAFAAMDRLLQNQRSSPMYLSMPEIARLVVDAIEQQAANGDYVLHAWVVMPNHVHLLITPRTDVLRLLRKLKGSTARLANKVLGRSGPFWQDESYDRQVRDSEEFRRIRTYIVKNPVNAGLARSAEEYPWSSAGGLKPAAG